MEKIFTIPLYDCILRIVVEKDIEQARKKFDSVYGTTTADNYEGLCCWSGGHNFGLFFTPSAARSINVISHEVFHLTHRIMEWAGCNFDKEHHEQGALLNGYLMKLVVQALYKKKRR
jgi:hypothetical protein